MSNRRESLFVLLNILSGLLGRRSLVAQCSQEGNEIGFVCRCEAEIAEQAAYASWILECRWIRDFWRWPDWLALEPCVRITLCEIDDFATCGCQIASVIEMNELLQAFEIAVVPVGFYEVGRWPSVNVA